MYRAAFSALGVDWDYQPLQVRPGQVARTLRDLGEAGGFGVNVTMPLKGEAFCAARRLTARARAVGVANVMRLDTWEADNTDAPGVDRALAAAAGDLFPGGGDPAAGGGGVVLGSGGAAKAAAFALAGRGLVVSVVSRDQARGEAVVARLGAASAGAAAGSHGGAAHRVLPWGSEAARAAVAAAAVVINATPLGMGDLAGQAPVPPDWPAPAGGLACDLVYRPPDTPFLDWARAGGAIAVSGLEVLLWQGALALGFWGLDAPLDAMRAALIDAVSGEEGR